MGALHSGQNGRWIDGEKGVAEWILVMALPGSSTGLSATDAWRRAAVGDGGQCGPDHQKVERRKT
jgi:hypothetical protein